MSQLQRSSKVFRIGAMLLGLLASIYLLISRRSTKSKKSNASKGIKQHKPATSPEDALKYWTADKMRHATPVDLPQVDISNRGKA